MKNCVLGLIVIALCCSCATSGPIVGPFSYMAAKSNQKARLTKAVLQSQGAPEAKQAALTAVSFGASPGEVAVGMGIDLMAIGNFSGMELGKQFLGVLGDLGLYVGAGAGIAAGIKSIEDSSTSKVSKEKSLTITTTGSSNTYNINTGDEATSNADDNRGTSE